MINRLYVIIVILACASIASGQPTSGNTPQPDITPVDLGIPESPALTVLGLSADKATRPGTLTAFAAAAANGVDDHGHVHSGVALNANPYRLYKANRLTIEDFRGVSGFYTRTAVSLATTQEASGNVGHVAVGFHTALFDAGEPHDNPNLIKCFQKALADNTHVIPPSPDKSAFVVDQAGLNKSAQACRDTFLAEDLLWNRSSWIVAVAPAWISSDDTLHKLRSDGGGAWTSVAWGFEQLGTNALVDGKPSNDSWLHNHAQVILHFRARNNEHVTDKNQVTTNHDSRLYGVRFRVGRARFNGSVELTHNTDRTSAVRNRRTTGVLAFEQRLAEGVWLNVSVGKEQTHGASSGVVARSTFHWQLNPKPIIK